MDDSINILIKVCVEYIVSIIKHLHSLESGCPSLRFFVQLYQTVQNILNGLIWAHRRWNGLCGEGGGNSIG